MKRVTKRQVLISLLFILLVSGLAALTGILVNQSFQDIRKREAEITLFHYSNNIVLQLQGSMNSADNLAEIALISHDNPNWFAEATDPLLKRREVRFVLYIDGDTTAAARPLETYGHLVGQDLKDYSYVYTMAKVTKNLVIEGPVVSEYSSGEREDVFLFLQPIIEYDAYLGQIVVGLSSDYVLSQFEMDSVVNQGYDYELWRVNPENGAKEVISISDAKVNFSYAAKTSFFLPTQWNLSIQPIDGWVNVTSRMWIDILCTLGGLLIIIAGGAIYWLSIQKKIIKNMDLTDRQTGFRNRRSFCNMLDEWLTGEDPFILFYFDFESYNRISQLIGPEEENAFLRSIPHSMEKYILKPYIAGRLSAGSFGLAVMEDMTELQREDFAKGLSLELLLKVRLNSDRSFLTAHYQYVRLEPGTAVADEVIKHLIKSYYDRISRESPARILASKCLQLIDGRTDVVFEEYTDVEMMELSKIFNQYRNRVEQLAYCDPVFNVGNRSKFLLDCNMLISYDKKRSFDIFCVDICSFSQYNEIFGTEIGDCILQEFVQRLSRSFGSHLYRINGDIFAGIILSEEKAVLFVDRLQKVLTTPITVENKEFTLSVRITACQYPVHGVSPVALLDCIQSTLRFAKDSGQKIVIYNNDLSSVIHREMEILNRLKLSILDNSLEVWYQPIFHLETGQYSAAEALVRLPDGQGGYFPASQVVTLAEHNGLIEQMGDYVLLQAEHFMCIHAEEFNLLHIGVNVSVQQLLVENSVDHLLTMIKESGIKPERITLEITESMLIQSLDKASAGLDRLRQTGIRIALDDFGVGYSSLNYLFNLPVDVIKIDRSLTQQITANIKQAALLRSIVDMAKINSMSVVAEGIETEEEKQFVNSAGIDYIQGFYYACPMSEEDFIRFLKDHR